MPSLGWWGLRCSGQDTTSWGHSSAGAEVGSLAAVLAKPKDSLRGGWGTTVLCLSPVEGQLVALEEVGMVVGAQGSLVSAVAANLLHLAVGVQQALLARPSPGPAAPKGSKETLAPLAEVGREEGVQLLPVEEGRRVLAAQLEVPGSQGRAGEAGLPGGSGHTSTSKSDSR